jgi:hypothetical protein
MVTLTPQFVTRYHVGLATKEWLRNLETHINNAIASHHEYQTSSGRGIVSSRHNEERFMGPMSLIKNDFDVTIRVSRRFSIWKDCYEATVRYIPESNEFENLRETVETVESKRRDNRNLKMVQQLCDHIATGCSRDIVDDWRCPWCETTVRVSFHRAGRSFAVSCSNGHFDKHASTNTPPDWWRDAITDDWLECGANDATEQSGEREPPMTRVLKS